MRILFVTSEVPYPPDNGVRIVPHHAMRLMAEAGHELALAVLTDEQDDVEERFELATSRCVKGFSTRIALPKRSRRAVFIQSWLHRRLFFIERYRCPAFREKLRQLVDAFRPDVIHYDLILMTQYRDAAPPGVGTVASINDSYALTLENALQANNYHGLQKLYRQRQYKQTRRYEASAYPCFDVTHTMTEVDASYLRRLNANIRTTAIPNGVEPSLFNIVERTLGLTDVIYVAKLVGDNLVYLQRFLSRAWHKIRQQYPNVRLHVVGKTGPQADAVRSMAEQLGGVIFHGYASDLAEAYGRCGISIVPVDKNCGIVNKAIEAMAAGLAVVGFDNTFAGIPQARSRENCICVKDYESMGQAVIDLLAGSDWRQSIQQAAHQTALQHYSWETRSIAYADMYQRAYEDQRKAIS